MTPIFLLLNYNQHEKMQLFAKLKKILRRGFRVTLNFQKFKVALDVTFGKQLIKLLILNSSSQKTAVITIIN